MKKADMIPRLVERKLVEALKDTPVVLLHGSRQSGKTTLAQWVGDQRGYAYFNFDDDVARSSAVADPAGFVAELPPRVILDEVQRVPELFAAIKLAVDRDRRPGRFLLTGSANVLFVPRVADSLAGRMEIVELLPLSQCEIGKQAPRFVSALFGGAFKTRPAQRLGRDLAERIVAGGYPAARIRASPPRRSAWYRNYIETIVQRDVRDLARINSWSALPRLLDLAAGQTARLLNISELAAPFQLSRPTIREYVTLLQRMFLIEETPAWHVNRLSRLVKTPKLHVGDTGWAAARMGLTAEALFADRELLGQFLETFVYQELRRLTGAGSEELRFHHFRDKDGYEVDIVLERNDRRLAGVEVKASGTVRPSDFTGLRKLGAATGDRFAAGVLLYDGETAARFGDRLYALPVSYLWETP